MCLIKGVFVGKRNFDVIKMHGTTIKKTPVLFLPHVLTAFLSKQKTGTQMMGPTRHPET